MNSTSSQGQYQLLAGTADASKPYDEERLQWGSVSRWWTWPKKYMRFPRLKRMMIFVLLFDVIIVSLLVHALQPLISLLRYNEELFSPHLVLSGNDTLHVNYHPDQYMIPRILHQTSATAVIPDKWIKAQRSCTDVYANYEYKLWTDERSRDFISTEYPWFLETWDNYEFTIQRADVIRYFVLHRFGGLYLDMDTYCNATIPLSQIEAGATTPRSVFKSTGPTGVTNDFMISPPGHPLFTTIISQLLVANKKTHFWARLQPYAAIMFSTGPLFITLTMKDYLLGHPAPPPLAVQIINDTALEAYTTHIGSSSWHKGDAQALTSIGDHRVVWFALGGMGTAAGLYVINYLLLLALRAWTKQRVLPKMRE